MMKETAHPNPKDSPAHVITCVLNLLTTRTKFLVYKKLRKAEYERKKGVCECKAGIGLSEPIQNDYA